jgi:hypothetical protein
MRAQAGANVNYANPNTPLVVATMRGLADCIKYLLEAGANPNISDKQVSFWSSIFFPFLIVVGKLVHMVFLLSMVCMHFLVAWCCMCMFVSFCTLCTPVGFTRNYLCS